MPEKFGLWIEKSGLSARKPGRLIDIPIILKFQLYQLKSFGFSTIYMINPGLSAVNTSFFANNPTSFY